MSDFIEKARRRLAVNGNGIGEVYETNTSAFIQEMFSDSPTFRVANVKSYQFPEITKMDVRVINVERMGSLREVMFRPYEGLSTGAYIEFDGNTWLLTDSWGSIETMQQKSLVQKCNHELVWAISEDWHKKDSEGNLVLDENKINRHICIASQSPLGSKSNQGRLEVEWNKYDVKLPFGQMYIFLEKNDITTSIKINNRFFLGSNVYEVVGIDDNTLVNLDGYGIIQLTTKVTTSQALDDFKNGIAFNKIKQDVEPELDDNDNGGVIW